MVPLFNVVLYTFIGVIILLSLLSGIVYIHWICNGLCNPENNDDDTDITLSKDQLNHHTDGCENNNGLQLSSMNGLTGRRKSSGAELHSVSQICSDSFSFVVGHLQSSPKVHSKVPSFEFRQNDEDFGELRNNEEGKPAAIPLLFHDSPVCYNTL